MLGMWDMRLSRRNSGIYHGAIVAVNGYKTKMQVGIRLSCDFLGFTVDVGVSRRPPKGSPPYPRKQHIDSTTSRGNAGASFGNAGQAGKTPEQASETPGKQGLSQNG